MADFPTYEQMAKNVAEKALDEILYNGKSIREWMKVIIDFDKTIEDIKAEIGRCKTKHELQISERDTKSKLLISDIFCDIIEIIDKHISGKEIEN